MATVISARAAFAMLLALVPMATRGDVPTIVSPLLDNICNEVECGKGTCEVDKGKPFNFVCKCESGWRRTGNSDEEYLQFLPCIIPDCFLDYSCMPTAPPSPVPHNFSFSDACYWMYCGDGTCSKTSMYRHTCQCNPGRFNLLDIPIFPCYDHCALGSDCARLGIILANTTSTSGSSNKAVSILQWKLQWIGILLISALAPLWKWEL